MLDALCLLVYRILNAGTEHRWVLAVPALCVLFVCAVLMLRHLRGKPVPGRFNCRRCGHLLPPLPDAHAGSASELPAQRFCAECGAGLTRRGAITPVMSDVRVVRAAWWACGAIAMGAWLVCIQTSLLANWKAWWAAQISRESILAGIQEGNLETLRAVKDSYVIAAHPLALREFREAVLRSPLFAGRDAPARGIWELSLLMDGPWFAAKSLQSTGGSTASDSPIGPEEQPAPGSTPALQHAFDSFADSLSFLPSSTPWPVLSTDAPSCTSSTPKVKLLKPARTLEQSESPRAFGRALVEGPWRLSVTLNRTAELEWVGPCDALLDLPLNVAGSYTLIVRQGNRLIARGALLACQIGPAAFQQSAQSRPCVLSSLELVARPRAISSDQLVMDLTPNSHFLLELSGYVPMSFHQDSTNPLRCDPESHVDVPLQLRLNGVPEPLLKTGGTNE